MVSKEEVKKYIWDINSKEEMHELVKIFKMRNRQLSEMAVLTFKVGDTVEFEGRRGRILKGKVTQLNKKTLNVLTDTNERWNVGPSLCKKI